MRRGSRCSRSARRRRRAAPSSSRRTGPSPGRRGSTSPATSRAGTCSIPPADVIVTDGFTGNVVLKTIEGTAKAVAGGVRDAARSGPRAAVGGLLLRPALGGLREQLDPDATGGAILLGLRGVAIVGHGSAGAEGIANQIRLAARAVGERAVERTEELIKRSGVGRGAIREAAAGADGEPAAGAVVIHHPR